MSLILLFAILLSSVSIEPSLINVHVDRSVDLVGHMPKVTIKMKVENTGNQPALKYDFYIEPCHQDKVSYLTWKTESLAMSSAPAIETNPGRGYELIFKQYPLQPKSSMEVTVEYVLYDVIAPLPELIEQHENQLVQFNFSSTLYSAYPTRTQTTTLSLASSAVESYTSVDMEPVQKTGAELKYGPYSDIEKFSDSGSTVHFTNNNRFLKVTNLDRLIRVSHWDAVTVEDRVTVEHVGAKLDRGFSRIDHMMTVRKRSAVESFQTVLPSRASRIYYRDDIGNISTSSVIKGDGSIRLELQPRFPLFGSWQVTYMTGYDLPVSSQTHRDGSKFTLRLRLIDHLMSDLDIDRANIMIALPEGAVLKKINLPYEASMIHTNPLYSYLDMVGRPTYLITAEHLTNWHIQVVEVVYEYEAHNLLRKPLYLASLVFSTMLFAMILVRTDLSISQGDQDDKKLRVHAEVGIVKEAIRKRDWALEKAKKALNKYDENRDLDKLTDAKKVSDAELRGFEGRLTASIDKLKYLDSGVYERLGSILRGSAATRESFEGVVQSAGKYSSGKINKAQFTSKSSSFVEALNTELNNCLDG